VCLDLRIDILIVFVYFFRQSVNRLWRKNCKSSLFFKIVQLTKVVYLLQINHIHCRTLITALVGIKVKCYLSFTFVRSNFMFLRHKCFSATENE
jgi:hypothetical protein